MSQKNNLYPILALAGVIFIDSIGFGLIFPILSPLLLDPVKGMLALHTSEGLRDIYYGLVLGSFAVLMFFCAPLLGDLSDRVGRKKMLLFCLVGTGFASLTCALSINIKSIAVLLIGRILTGVFAGSQPIAQAAMADVSSGAERVKNLGLISAAGSAGFVFGPIIGGYFSDKQLVSWFSFATPFYLDAALAFLNAFLLYITFSETYQSGGKLKLNLMKAVHILVQGFKKKVIRIPSIILLLLELTFALYIQFISLYLVAQFHFSSIRLGVFMSVSGGVFAITLGILVRILIRFVSEKQLMIFGLGLSVIGYLLPYFVHAEYMQWIALFPIIMGIGTAYNALLAIFSNSVSEHEQGWVMGITSAVMAVAWIFGSFGASLFFYIDPNFPYIMSALFVFIGLVVGLFFKKSVNK